MTRKFTNPDLDLSIFSYDPITGVVIRTFKSGEARAVGTVDRYGYLSANLNYQHVAVHRLAWRLHYGYWPEQTIDHKNGNKTLNSVENMRLATHQEQRRNIKLFANNTTGHKGVRHNKSANRPFRAVINLDGKAIELGSFRTAEEASAVYDRRALELFGEFVLPNAPVAGGQRRDPVSKRIGVEGVRGRWTARILHDGRHVHLGDHPTAWKAANAFDQAALDLKGRDAMLNNPAWHILGLSCPDIYGAAVA